MVFCNITDNIMLFFVAAMPDKCCAPGCTANYDNTADYISVFRFPADELRRQQWLRLIPRANLNVTKRTVVCQRHFEKRFVLTEDKVLVNGVETVITRQRPRLTDDAVPTIFHNIPGYLSTPLPPKRKTPDDRHQELQQRLNDSFTDWLSSDEVKVFSDVTDNLLAKLEQYMQQWNYKLMDDCVWFYLLSFHCVPCVTCCIQLCSNLNVCVFVNGARLHDNQLAWILGAGCVLSRWSQLENLLSHYAGTDGSVYNQDLTFVQSIKMLCDVISKKLDDDDNEDEFDNDDDDDDKSYNVACIKFCVEQLQLAMTSPYSRRYSNKCYNLPSPCTYVHRHAIKFY